MKNYNEILKDLREDNEDKQETIAKHLGITKQQYSLYERAERKIPINLFKELCVYYNVSADYILGLPDNMPYPKR